MRLFELTGNLLAVYQQVDNEEANLDTLEDTLQAIEGAIEVKAQGIVQLVKMLDADCDTITEEIKRLQLRKKARDNRISRIKQYLQEQMELIGKDKISTPLMTVSLQANPPSVDDFCPNLIPSEYHTVVYNVNKAAILQALKAGHEVPGCVLKQGKGLRIR